MRSNMSGNPIGSGEGVTTLPEQRADAHTRRAPPYNVILENTTTRCNSRSSCRARRWAVRSSGPWQIRTFHEVRERDDKQLGPVGCTIEPAPGG
jgi:hypothetical protein